MDLLIEAFGKIARKADVLLLAGPTPNHKLALEIRTLPQKCCSDGGEVRFTGELIPDDKLQVYFNACDMVSLPFRDILNSGTLMLAMSFGRCVVAPKMGSIPEIACPEAYFGYDANDPAGLVSALCKALDQPDLLERGQASKQFARQRYDWKDIGLKVRRLYEEILG